ncbi:hypothetical protein PR048_027686 [Dryococelus australis]|uniref:Uncharacterized protein n=1 Tax=Dryococelus australis TaxID=614101 RepID=A0ABQ9GH76_9NEOP|nr:hypothetical protein PR048_027686 [Dryococelus australis]
MVQAASTTLVSCGEEPYISIGHDVRRCCNGSARTSTRRRHGRDCPQALVPKLFVGVGERERERERERARARESERGLWPTRTAGACRQASCCALRDGSLCREDLGCDRTSSTRLVNAPLRPCQPNVAITWYTFLFECPLALSVRRVSTEQYNTVATMQLRVQGTSGLNSCHLQSWGRDCQAGVPSLRRDVGRQGSWWTNKCFVLGTGGREGGRVRGRGGIVVRLLASHLGQPDSFHGGVAPGFSHVKSWRTMPLPLQSSTAPNSPRFTLIGSQELDVKSRPNLFTHALVTTRRLQRPVIEMAHPLDIPIGVRRSKDWQSVGKSPFAECGNRVNSSAARVIGEENRRRREITRRRRARYFWCEMTIRRETRPMKATVHERARRTLEYCGLDGGNGNRPCVFRNVRPVVNHCAVFGWGGGENEWSGEIRTTLNIECRRW